MAEIRKELANLREQWESEKLGVGDPEDGGKGTKVVLSGPGFSYAVVLGESAQGRFRYARVDGEAESSVIDRNPEVPDEPQGGSNSRRSTP